MENIRTGTLLKNMKMLEAPMLYIYVMNTENGKVKIGKTTNIEQRYQSLSGSNSQGNPITSVYCSKETSLYTIERIMHDHFARYRLEDTEWFVDASDETKTRLFNEACTELERLFQSPGCNNANDVRIYMYNMANPPKEAEEKTAS
jgi:predicted GIY-YIG superfamily endonuclease